MTLQQVKMTQYLVDEIMIQANLVLAFQFCQYLSVYLLNVLSLFTELANGPFHHICRSLKAAGTLQNIQR